MRKLLCTLVLATSFASAAHAGPPSYLLLRQPESPGPHGKPGQSAAQYFDVRSDGYAYGYFGVGPRTHWSRHFGVNRMVTQWSRW